MYGLVLNVQGFWSSQYIFTNIKNVKVHYYRHQKGARYSELNLIIFGEP